MFSVSIQEMQEVDSCLALFWYLRPISCLLSIVHLTWQLETDFLVIEITPVLQISSKDEDFLDLSVDVEQNTSITHCLRFV